MTRRSISVLLVLCLVANLMSCYSMKTHEYKGVPPTLTDYDSIVVHTKDGKTQTFVNGMVIDRNFVGKDDQGKVTKIPTDEISYVELTRKEMSTGVKVLAIVGAATLGTVLLLATVVIATSCPQISSFDGEHWVLEAEPNGGAITKTTEYTDHNVLRHLRALPGGTYRIRLETNLDEIDFTDEIKLLAVDHPTPAEVIPDIHGNLLAISKINRPDYAMTDTGIDLLKEFNAKGELFWDGDIRKQEYDKNHPRDEIQLKFKKPEGSRHGVLVLKGSSTFWSMYIMADFLSKFGKSAAERFERLETDPDGRAKIARFMEKSGCYIDVLVKNNDDWMNAGYLKTAGTYVPKTQALQLDLPDDSAGMVEVKLRYAPFFWNIQDLGMSFSYGDDSLQVTELVPLEAIDAKGADVKGMLMAKDESYYRTEKGDFAEMSFPVPPLVEGLERTLVLKTSGYYNLILDKDREMPFLAKTWQAVKMQGIDGYSLERFREIQQRAGYR
ncbi:MAG: hypothetical protein V1694_07915 [Candidatus Eisenbacteria bacterium]